MYLVVLISFSTWFDVQAVKRYSSCLDVMLSVERPDVACLCSVSVCGVVTRPQVLCCVLACNHSKCIYLADPTRAIWKLT